MEEENVPYVSERCVVLIPRHFTGMAKAASYLDVPPHDVRAAFVQGCMVTSRRDGRSWFVDAKEADNEQ